VGQGRGRPCDFLNPGHTVWHTCGSEPLSADSMSVFTAVCTVRLHSLPTLFNSLCSPSVKVQASKQRQASTRYRQLL
jgi:hypothetical protein